MHKDKYRPDPRALLFLVAKVTVALGVLIGNIAAMVAAFTTMPTLGAMGVTAGVLICDAFVAAVIAEEM